MVYVLSNTGKTLMPTQHYGKVKHLLRNGLAVVVRRDPFTIQLTYDSKQFTQPVNLGVRVGTDIASLSATTEKEELFSTDAILRNDISKALVSRREARRTRRSRKTRHRKARLDNRKRPKEWLAPSIEQKVQSYLNLIAKVNAILPVSKTIIQVAAFDTQLIKNPDIQGVEYQQGPQLNFWNVRDYVLYRDGHRCLHCKGKSGDKILNVHHIVHRTDGGSDSPDNLITLCETCHNRHHREGMEIKAKPSFRSLQKEAVMSIMRWEVYNRTKALYNNVHQTFGYITKYVRINNGLEKSHAVDARCISGHPKAIPCSEQWMMRQVANHSRALHVQNMTKGGKRRSAIAPHYIGKTRLQRHDRVLWNGIKCFIAGSTNGRPILRDINWALVTPTASVNPKTVTFLSRKRGGFILQNI